MLGARTQGRLLHIVGCQRSGTTMLTEILDRDPTVRVFDELGELFDNVERHHRLRDTTEVVRHLDRSGATLNVVKPLVESHRCDDLLALAERSQALWMFRHYGDVASSNLRRFGDRNGIDNLRPIVNDDVEWRTAGLAAGTRAIVRRHFDERMAPHDAAALFWYCRNTLFFDQRLDDDHRIRTCRYEQLVTDPDPMVAQLYRWIGLELPRHSITDHVHAQSVGKGEVEISTEIRSLCDGMLERLIDTDRRRSLTART